MLKVSVIVPVYNTEPYLRECFDSLVSQTYKNIEIIIVNDGSTDNSIDIINEYANKFSNIKIVNQENKGYSGARNTALEYVTGDYVGFVDSDDYIKPDMFEKLITTAENNNADIVSCSFFRVYENEPVAESNEMFFNALNKNKKEHSSTIVSCPELILDDAFIWNRIYKTEFLKQHNIVFPDDITFGEDTYFHRIALMHANFIEYLKDPLYYYRQNRPNAQTTLKDKRNMSFLFNCENLYTEAENLELKELYPYLNHLTLSLCSTGYERIDNEFKKEYFSNFVKLIHKIKKPFKISFPNYKNTSFVIKARYIMLKFLHPILYFSLNINSKCLFDFIINLRELFQDIQKILKNNKARKK